MTVVARFAAVLRAIPRERRTLHFVGMPPEVGGDDDRQLMGWPVALVLEEESTGAAMLYRFAHDGESMGDTWHENLADAKHQALFEYGDCLTPWEPVPGEEPDAVSYALRLARPS